MEHRLKLYSVDKREQNHLRGVVNSSIVHKRDIRKNFFPSLVFKVNDVDSIAIVFFKCLVSLFIRGLHAAVLR